MTYESNCTLPDSSLEQIAEQELDILPDMSRIVINSATLLGAAERIRRETGIDILPHERAEYDGEVAAMREAAPEAFASAWQQGHQLNNDEIVAVALSGERRDA